MSPGNRVLEDVVKVEVDTKEEEGNQSQSITCCRTAGAERKNCRVDDKATQEGQVNNSSFVIGKHHRPEDLPRRPRGEGLQGTSSGFAFWRRVKRGDSRLRLLNMKLQAAAA